jgi:hypothetical protein
MSEEELWFGFFVMIGFIFRWIGHTLIFGRVVVPVRSNDVYMMESSISHVFSFVTSHTNFKMLDSTIGYEKLKYEYILIYQAGQGQSCEDGVF